MINLNGSYYLKPEVKLDPLVNSWPAWSHLIAPVQHAMQVTFRHLPMLQSYVQNPCLHYNASNQADNYAGPYVQLPAEEVNSVHQLLAKIRGTSSKEFVEFGRSVREFSRALPELSRGRPLAEVYGQLPSPLKGCTEIVYAAENVPVLRFVEPILYRSSLMRTQQQSLCLSQVHEDARPFFLNTPLLENEKRLLLNIPFKAPAVDVLGSARIIPHSLQDLCNILEVPPITIAPYLTTEPPVCQSPEYIGNDLRIRYFGHACVLIQRGGKSVLIDPLVAWEPEATGTKFTFSDLPKQIDCVVITHGHHDHLCSEVLLQLRSRIREIIVPQHNCGNIFDPSLKLVLQALGFTCVRALESFESIQVGGMEITSLPFIGEHADLDIYAKQGVLVRSEGRTVALLADSDAVDPEMCASIRRFIDRDIDLLFIGMECDGAPLSWLYGPLMTKVLLRADDEIRRLSGSNCAHAWNAVTILGCRHVLVYAMGQDPWVRHLTGLAYTPEAIQVTETTALLDRCRTNGIRAEYLTNCTEYLLPLVQE